MRTAWRRGGSYMPIVHAFNHDRGRTVCGQKVTPSWTVGDGDPDCNLCRTLLSQEAQPEVVE